MKALLPFLLLTLSLAPPALWAQFMDREITGFFSQLESLGQPPAQECPPEIDPPSFTPEGEDPNQYHRQVSFDIGNIQTTTHEGREISVLTPEQAQKLFEEFSKLDYLPTKYLEDGCYARAHELALVAQQNGIEMGKAFMLPPEEGPQRLLYPENFKDGQDNPFHHSFSGWRYHSTAYLMVKDGDEIRPVVFDLGVSESYQDFERWRENLSPRSKDAQIVTRERPYIFQDGNYSSTESIIGNLIETESQIDELGYDEYIFRLEQGWL